MKCPKCGYLGFETGDRCRNCEYDFSLIAGADTQAMVIDFDIPDPVGDVPRGADLLMRAEEGAAARVPPRSPGAPRRPRDPNLPLFTSPSVDRQDEPLIKLPVTPRPPLAVRRTPDTARLRVATTAVRAAKGEPALEFGESGRGAAERERVEVTASGPLPRASAADGVKAGDVIPLVRASAAAIDLLLLGAIDAGVVYFTLRIAGLSMSEWAVLPAVPLVCFLLVLKLAYFCAFTAVGGQTIGKMALGIRVVTEDHGSIDAALALRRTMVGAASAAFLGLGFLVAIFDPERRVLHDRVARTRVVALRAA